MEVLSTFENQYLQGDDSHCLILSLCFALHYYFREDNIPNALRDFAQEVVTSLQCFDKLEKIISDLITDHFIIHLCSPGDMEQNKFDPLIDQSQYPTLFVPVGEDGSCSHAVSMINNWVFESNSIHPITISNKFLDWCVRTDEEENKYVGVNYAIRLVPKPPMINNKFSSDKRCVAHKALAAFFSRSLNTTYQIIY